jgi:hypothetical protein
MWGNAMSLRSLAHTFVTLAAALAAATAIAQPPGGPGGPRPEPEIEGIPRVPTAVPLPTLSAPVTGPGAAFDSAPSLAPELGLARFRYETTEYFASGTAAGKPYTTRVVVRQPADDRAFSGLVLAESMHGSGAAHMFEFVSGYLMDEGHAAVEIVTTSPQQFVAFNAARYGDMKVENGQQNEIIAQVGALMRSTKSPLAGAVRKMVLGGTSMSAGTLINYLPAHMMFRTPEMNRVYDGFMPTSTGSTIREIDVPIIQMPTMHEVETNVTRRQDSDEPGKQFRLYEFAAIGHVDSRDNVRLLPNPCTKPLSTFLTQAYFAVTLHHLLRWVDEGIAPPRAPRILLDRDESNDGSSMVLDQHGNPLGGIRSPYVDVPTAKYAPVNTAADPVVANASEYVRANGLQGAQIMCRLSAYQEPFSQAKLQELYRNEREYSRQFTARLDELEQQGWSLPVYRETILADVAKTEF